MSETINNDLQKKTTQNQKPQHGIKRTTTLTATKNGVEHMCCERVAVPALCVAPLVLLLFL